jgi:hypothetical protein
MLKGPADVAQLVERNLAKVKVAGSRPVVRSGDGPPCRPLWMAAAWPSGSGKGLQNPLPGFNSRRRLESLGPAGARIDGRLAQGESASLTRKRSEVQIL